MIIKRKGAKDMNGSGAAWPRLVTLTARRVSLIHPPIHSYPLHFTSSESSHPFHKDESAPRFMSDIRLHTLRNSRTRDGFVRHDSSSRQHPSASANLASGSHSGSRMPVITTAAAAAAAVSSSSSSFSSSRRNKGRLRNEYGDGEPEEEATLLGEGERDPGFLHDDDEEEEEEVRPIHAERAHDAASQVRAQGVSPASPLITSRTSAVVVAERIKRQISDSALTTTRCVYIRIHIKTLLTVASGKTSCRASFLLTSFATRSTMCSPSYPSSFTSSSSFSSTSISSSSPYPNSSLPSEPVRPHFLRTIVDLTTSLYRFPCDVHCPACFCSPRYDGQGSLRRLPAQFA